MKITDVKTLVVRDIYDFVIVRVETDAGIYGLGEPRGLHAGQELVESTIAYLKTLLVGEDPRNVDRLYRKMVPSWYTTGLSPRLEAISAIEMALWDITGKALGAPVYQLLGGRHWDRIRMYADGEFGIPLGALEEHPMVREEYTPEAYGEVARRVKALGYTIFKMDLDLEIAQNIPGGLFGRHLTNAGIDYFASLVGGIREAVGYGIEVGIDFHCASATTLRPEYTTNNAIRMCHALEPYRLIWVEDPVPLDNVEAWCKVTDAIKTPTMVGGPFHTRFSFREYIERQAVDLLHPDVANSGGIMETKRIADMADLYYMSVAIHNTGGPVATMASVHTAAAIPNFLALEFHHLGLSWFWDLIKGPKPVIKAGFVDVPEAPGLGVELEERVVRQHLRDGDTYFE